MNESEELVHRAGDLITSTIDDIEPLDKSGQKYEYCACLLKEGAGTEPTYSEFSNPLHRVPNTFRGRVLDNVYFLQESIIECIQTVLRDQYLIPQGADDVMSIHEKLEEIYTDDATGKKAGRDIYYINETQRGLLMQQFAQSTSADSSGKESALETLKYMIYNSVARGLFMPKSLLQPDNLLDQISACFSIMPILHGGVNWINDRMKKAQEVSGHSDQFRVATEDEIRRIREIMAGVVPDAPTDTSYRTAIAELIELGKKRDYDLVINGRQVTINTPWAFLMYEPIGADLPDVERLLKYGQLLWDWDKITVNENPKPESATGLKAFSMFRFAKLYDVIADIDEETGLPLHADNTWRSVNVFQWAVSCVFTAWLQYVSAKYLNEDGYPAIYKSYWVAKELYDVGKYNVRENGEPVYDIKGIPLEIDLSVLSLYNPTGATCDSDMHTIADKKWLKSAKEIWNVLYGGFNGKYALTELDDAQMNLIDTIFGDKFNALELAGTNAAVVQYDNCHRAAGAATKIIANLSQATKMLTYLAGIEFLPTGTLFGLSDTWFINMENSFIPPTLDRFGNTVVYKADIDDQTGDYKLDENAYHLEDGVVVPHVFKVRLPIEVTNNDALPGEEWYNGKVLVDNQRIPINSYVPTYAIPNTVGLDTGIYSLHRERPIVDNVFNLRSRWRGRHNDANYSLDNYGYFVPYPKSFWGRKTVDSFGWNRLVGPGYYLEPKLNYNTSETRWSSASSNSVSSTTMKVTDRQVQGNTYMDYESYQFPSSRISGVSHLCGQNMPYANSFGAHDMSYFTDSVCHGVAPINTDRFIHKVDNDVFKTVTRCLWRRTYFCGPADTNIAGWCADAFNFPNDDINGYSNTIHPFIYTKDERVYDDDGKDITVPAIMKVDIEYTDNDSAKPTSIAKWTDKEPAMWPIFMDNYTDRFGNIVCDYDSTAPITNNIYTSPEKKVGQYGISVTNGTYIMKAGDRYVPLDPDSPVSYYFYNYAQASNSTGDSNVKIAAGSCYEHVDIESEYDIYKYYDGLSLNAFSRIFNNNLFVGRTRIVDLKLVSGKFEREERAGALASGTYTFTTSAPDAPSNSVIWDFYPVTLGSIKTDEDGAVTGWYNQDGDIIELRQDARADTTSAGTWDTTYANVYHTIAFTLITYRKRPDWLSAASAPRWGGAKTNSPSGNTDTYYYVEGGYDFIKYSTYNSPNASKYPSGAGGNYATGYGIGYTASYTTRTGTKGNQAMTGKSLIVGLAQTIYNPETGAEEAAHTAYTAGYYPSTAGNDQYQFLASNSDLSLGTGYPEQGWKLYRPSTYLSNRFFSGDGDVKYIEEWYDISPQSLNQYKRDSTTNLAPTTGNATATYGSFESIDAGYQSIVLNGYDRKGTIPTGSTNSWTCELLINHNILAGMNDSNNAPLESTINMKTTTSGYAVEGTKHFSALAYPYEKDFKLVVDEDSATKTIKVEMEVLDLATANQTTATLKSNADGYYLPYSVGGNDNTFKPKVVKKTFIFSEGDSSVLDVYLMQRSNPSYIRSEPMQTSYTYATLHSFIQKYGSLSNVNYDDVTVSNYDEFGSEATAPHIMLNYIENINGTDYRVNGPDAKIVGITDQPWRMSDEYVTVAANDEGFDAKSMGEANKSLAQTKHKRCFPTVDPTSDYYTMRAYDYEDIIMDEGHEHDPIANTKLLSFTRGYKLEELQDENKNKIGTRQTYYGNITRLRNVLNAVDMIQENTNYSILNSNRVIGLDTDTIVYEDTSGLDAKYTYIDVYKMYFYDTLPTPMYNIHDKNNAYADAATTNVKLKYENDASGDNMLSTLTKLMGTVASADDANKVVMQFLPGYINKFTVYNAQWCEALHPIMDRYYQYY